jgi:hypothetical protein
MGANWDKSKGMSGAEAIDPFSNNYSLGWGAQPIKPMEPFHPMQQMQPIPPIQAIQPFQALPQGLGRQPTMANMPNAPLLPPNPYAQQAWLRGMNRPKPPVKP